MNTDPRTQAQALVRHIIRYHHPRLRFLATGFMRIAECSLGGHCHCGKTLEERDRLFTAAQLLEAIDYHAAQWDKHQQELEARLLDQIRQQCPPGYVIDQAILEEFGDEDAAEVLRVLHRQAAREAVPG